MLHPDKTKACQVVDIAQVKSLASVALDCIGSNTSCRLIPSTISPPGLIYVHMQVVRGHSPDRRVQARWVYVHAPDGPPCVISQTHSASRIRIYKCYESTSRFFPRQSTNSEIIISKHKTLSPFPPQLSFLSCCLPSYVTFLRPATPAYLTSIDAFPRRSGHFQWRDRQRSTLEEVCTSSREEDRGHILG